MSNLSETLVVCYAAVFLMSCKENGEIVLPNSIETSQVTKISSSPKVANDSENILQQTIMQSADSLGISVGEATVISFNKQSINIPDRKIEEIAINHMLVLVNEPDSVVDAIEHSELNSFRRSLVTLAVSGFVKPDGSLITYPLEKIYKLLPESEDRSTVALAMVESEYDQSGLRGAISAINRLDSRSDKNLMLNGIRGRVNDDIRAAIIPKDTLVELQALLQENNAKKNFRIMVQQEIDKK